MTLLATLGANGSSCEAVGEDLQNIGKLLKGRIDLISYADARLGFDAEKYGYDSGLIEKVLDVPEAFTRVYIAFNKSTDDQIVADFKKGSIKKY
jgi:hypothetical protein